MKFHSPKLYPAELCHRASAPRVCDGSKVFKFREGSYTTSHVAQANWRPAEDMGNRDEGRARTPLLSSEIAQDRRAWSASVRDVVNAIGDAGSTRPG